MDENQIYNDEQESGEGEPMTLDDALAMARSRFDTDTAEASAEPSETASDATSEAGAENGAPASENVSEGMSESQGEPESNTTPARSPETEALMAQLDKQNRMLEQYQAQMQAMQEQMQALQSQASETNRSEAERVAEALTTPPVIDFSEIMYASEDEQRAATQKFVDDTVAYAESKIMQRLAPVVNEYKSREAAAERTNAKERFRRDGQFADFSEREPWIEQLIDKNEWMRGLPIDKQYEVGYLLTQGVDALKAKNSPAPAPPSIDQRLEAALSDDELMRAIEARRIRDAQSKSSEVPPAFAAGGGTSRVGINVPEEAGDFATAKQRSIARLFGRK